MAKMFVHYSGTVADFSKLSNISEYANKIVFIKGGADGKGAAIYTHGNYYANLNEALASLKYISSVKAGGVTATATGPNGVIEFSAADPTTVSVAADSTGVSIGLTADFKKVVSDNTAGVAANAQAIIDEASARGTAITTAKNELTAEINKKADSTVVTGVDDRVKAIEADYLKATDIAGKLDTSVYEAKVAELAKADTDNLKAAKDYADAEIAKLNSAAVAAQVEANKQAIEVLNGDVNTENSVRYITAAEVAKIINDNDTTSINTLEEIAAWIAAHPNSVAAINKEISDVKALVGTTAVATQIANAINDLDVTDVAEDGKYVSAVSETDGKISVTRADLPTYTLASGSANGTVAFNGSDVAVKGLGSAAYTETSAYATAAQGTKADNAAPANTVYTKTEVDAFWAWEEL